MQVLCDPALPGFLFGEFRLDPERRLLERGGVAVSLSARAFDILVLLVQSRDRILSRSEIIAGVWAGLTVDEHNLSVQMSSLRRALGDGGPEPRLIATIPGRGYRFIGAVQLAGAARVPDPIADIARPPVVPDQSPDPSDRASPPRRFALPVIAFLMLALSAAMLWRGATPGGPAANAPRLSIVVLPFRNLSDGGAKPYLADAVSDDLTTDLSRIPGSVVIARETADTYKNRPTSVVEIGRALHVRYAVEGSIRAENATLKINAQLIDTSNSAHLWAQRFTTSVDAAGQTQTDIARRIASALDSKLLDVESARSAHMNLKDADSLDLFFQARQAFEQDDTLDGMTRAQHLLEKALALRPDDGAALGELGLVLVRKRQGFDDQDVGDLHEAQDVVRRALALDPRNAAALVARGRMLQNAGQYDEASANFAAALQSDPDNVLALTGTAYASWRAGKPEDAIQPLQTAIAIDPESGMRRNRLSLLGMAMFMAGRPADAMSLCRQAIAGDAQGSHSDASLGRSEFCNLFIIASENTLGHAQEAHSQYEEYAGRWPHRSAWRLQRYFTPEQRRLPQFASFIHALVESGMPLYVDEHADFHVPPPDREVNGGDFDPTPTVWPGGPTIGATAVNDAVRQGRSLVIDVGAGIEKVPHAITPALTDRDADQIDSAVQSIAGGPGQSASQIIVMGDGVNGWVSYNASLRLAKLGYHHIAWFRGGEEALARQRDK